MNPGAVPQDSPFHKGEPNRMIDFNGQVVIVTGAGRGLGRLYAMELARRGASVVVNDVGSTMHGSGSDSAIADQVVKEIVSSGGKAIASQESVATPEGGEAIVSIAVDTFGRLDAVVSNAGILQIVAFDQLKVDDWRRMLNVHLDGAFYVSQPAFRVMKAQGYGRFVFITSSAGMFGTLNFAHYAAAKAGVVGLTNAIALEGAGHGILANSVLPWGFTRMVAGSIGLDETIGVDSEQLADHPLPPFFKAMDPGLVVPIVVFLASRACILTHHNYSACAGRYARVFIGLGEGWLAEPNHKPTAEDIEAHLSEVSATQQFTVPTSIVDEMVETCALLGITS